MTRKPHRPGGNSTRAMAHLDAPAGLVVVVALMFTLWPSKPAVLRQIPRYGASNSLSLVAFKERFLGKLPVIVSRPVTHRGDLSARAFAEQCPDLAVPLLRKRAAESSAPEQQGG